MGSGSVDAIVVGAGVVGLACAQRLSQDGLKVVVVERHRAAGHETSSRNSGVIHGGIYYPAGSLKAQLCARGRELLYPWCEAHGVPYAKTGKLIVAVDESERIALNELAAHARSIGAEGIELWDEARLRKAEPDLRGVAAVCSPASGILDVHAFMDSLVATAASGNVDFAWKTSVESAEPRKHSWIVRTTDTLGRASEIEASLVLNSAGLESDRLAVLMGVDVDAHDWRIHPCKGAYFSLSSAAPKPKTALVYPLPGRAGLGIHLTRDLAGQTRAGPDAVYVDAINYDVEASKADAFAKSVQAYLPGIKVEHLQPDYAGIRPKLQKKGERPRDFVIAQEKAATGARAIHLVGIESPGLTAALAIAELVAKKVG